MKEKRFSILMVPLNDDRCEGISLSKTSIYILAILFLGIFIFGIISFILKPYRFKTEDTLKNTLLLLENMVNKTDSFNERLNKELDKIIDSLYPRFDQFFLVEDDEANIIDLIKAKLYLIKSFVEFNRGYKSFLSFIPSIFPTLGGGGINSPFGVRLDPFTGELSFHSGVDIFRLPGVPVRATGNGVVKFAGWNPNYGFMVVIEHSYGYTTLYAHMQPNLIVKVGDSVKQGQFIGYVGSTGRSLGYHLHYEVRLNEKYLNPVDFLYLYDQF